MKSEKEGIPAAVMAEAGRGSLSITRNPV